jgi:DNA-binding NtrC family response regulator
MLLSSRVIITLVVSTAIVQFQLSAPFLGAVHKPDIPVILSSDYSCARAISDFSSQGFSGFLQNPYDTIRVNEAIESIFKQ